MRVLFVSHKFPPQKGGVGVSAQRIAQFLGRWCESVHVLHATRELPPAVVSSRDAGALTIFTLGETDRGAESGQLLESSIRSLHQRYDYQVVIGFYAVPTGYQAVFSARLLGLPSVLCLRGNDVDRAIYHDGQNSALRWALKHATRVVGVSTELVQKASLFSGRDDFLTIANSVDCSLFRPSGQKPEPGNILFTGEMRLKKGSGILFESLAQIEGDWTLTVAGGFRGRAESEYRRWALSERALAARVRLLPYERDPETLSALYAKSELVINPALWDGMPNSVLEAMACGRPVLTTNVGGLSDLVSHRDTGYLLELSELDQLGERIRQALDDPAREQVGQRARGHVLTHHAPETEAAAYRALLEGL